jgi:hypothetical protein
MNVMEKKTYITPDVEVLQDGLGFLLCASVGVISESYAIDYGGVDDEGILEGSSRSTVWDYEDVWDDEEK